MARTLLILIFFPLLAQAQKSPEAYPPLLKYGFGKDLAVTSDVYSLIDTPGISPDEPDTVYFSAIAQRPFTASYTALVRQLFKDPRPYAFWLKFGLRNQTAAPLDLSVNCGRLDYTNLYFVSPGRPLQRVIGGFLRRPPAASSYTQRRSSVLPLRLEPYESGELFVEIRQRTDEYDFNGLEIYDHNTLNSYFVQDVMEWSNYRVIQLLFQGFLLCQMLYVLFQWLILRRREYLYYFCYMAGISLYFLSKQESILGLDLLFTRYPLLKIYLGKTLLICPYFFYFRFVRSFLEMRENYPRLYRWVRWMEYFLLAYIVFDFCLILYTFDRRLQTDIYFIVLIGVFILAARFMLYMYHRKKTLIAYIITGSLFVGTGHIIGLVFSYLEFNRHIDLGVPDIFIFSQLGIVLEIFCFTAGLSYKSQASEKEKIKSQENLIEQLKANELLQSRMQNIRNKIAQDLHDDIGSTLSSISILSDLAMKEKNSGQTLMTMNEIKDSSILLMERMDDIVWSINPRNDSLENLLVRVKHFATTLFEAREIDYTINIQENIHQVKLPMDYRQHIYLVLKEAINNLVKYAGATQADIRVSFDHQVLTLSIKDDGHGFDPSCRSSGNGIPGMQKRASLMNAALDIRSDRKEGTEISLRVDIP